MKMQSQPIETVFVAERSTKLLEDVGDYAKKIGLKNLKLVFNQGERGLTAARNLGVKVSSGEILAFVVDDAVLSPNWIEEILRTFEDNSIIGVTGPALPLWQDEPMDWLSEELHWVIGSTSWSHYKDLREVRTAWGMNMAFRRKAFDLCGDFRNTIGLVGGDEVSWKKIPADDNEFSLRVRRVTRQRIVYNPRVAIFHKVRRRSYSVKLIAKEAFRIGSSRAMLRKLTSEYRLTRVIDEDGLRLEVNLLPRIITSSFRRMIMYLVSGNFRKAWLSISATLLILLFTAIGYLQYSFQLVWRRYR